MFVVLGLNNNICCLSTERSMLKHFLISCIFQYHIFILNLGSTSLIEFTINICRVLPGNQLIFEIIFGLLAIFSINLQLLIWLPSYKFMFYISMCVYTQMRFPISVYLLLIKENDDDVCGTKILYDFWYTHIIMYQNLHLLE